MSEKDLAELTGMLDSKGTKKPSSKQKVIHEEPEPEAEEEPQVSEVERKRQELENKKKLEDEKRRKKELAEKKRLEEEARKKQEEEEKRKATLLQEENIEKIVLKQIEKITEKKLLDLEQYYKQQMKILEDRVMQLSQQTSQKKVQPLWRNVSEIIETFSGDCTIEIKGVETQLSSLKIGNFRERKTQGGYLEKIIAKYPEKEKYWKLLSSISRLGSLTMDQFLTIQSKEFS